MFVVLLLLVVTSPVAAQDFQISGRVLAVSAQDTIPVPDTWVVLHRVDSTGGQPIDSVRTTRDGRYALQAPPNDSLALFIPAVEHLEIAYFGTAMRSPIGTSMDTSETIFVFDTTSLGEPLILAEKHFVLRDANEDGSRPVLELLVIENRTSKVRISSDGVTPVWQGSLPPGAFDLEMAPSDVSPDAISSVDGTVILVAPIPPGQKQLVYGYTLPAGLAEVLLPIDQPIERIQLLLSDTLAVVRSADIQPQGISSVEMFRFARWEGEAPTAGAGIEIQFAETPFAIEEFWWVVVLLGGVGFALALGLALRNPRRVAVVADPGVLAARIAEIDRILEEGVASEDLKRERSELRAQLAAALARRQGAG